jgi:hypothetical protein
LEACGEQRSTVVGSMCVESAPTGLSRCDGRRKGCNRCAGHTMVYVDWWWNMTPDPDNVVVPFLQTENAAAFAFARLGSGPLALTCTADHPMPLEAVATATGRVYAV